MLFLVYKTFPKKKKKIRKGRVFSDTHTHTHIVKKLVAQKQRKRERKKKKKFVPFLAAHNSYKMFN